MKVGKRETGGVNECISIRIRRGLNLQTDKYHKLAGLTRF